jgi:hypothetical protein
MSLPICITRGSGFLAPPPPHGWTEVDILGENGGRKIGGDSLDESSSFSMKSINERL